MTRDENMIAALKRERAGYVARGDADRVAQVDEQLRRHGYAPEEETPPQGRTSTDGQQHTAAVVELTVEAAPTDVREAVGGAAAAEVVAPSPEAEPQHEAAPDTAAAPTAPADPVEPKKGRGRGRPTLPRDAEGNIIRD